MINNVLGKRKEKKTKTFQQDKLSWLSVQFHHIFNLALKSFRVILHIEMRVCNTEKHAKCLISSLEGTKISSPSQKHSGRDRSPAQKLVQLEKRINLSMG